VDNGAQAATQDFDEHGGFLDHLPPPECQDDTKLAGPGPHPNLKRLGFGFRR